MISVRGFHRDPAVRQVLTKGYAMNRFIVLTFLFLGWGFYELSGGADFVPETRGDKIAAAQPAEAPAEEELVTRASTMSSEIALTTAMSGEAKAVATETAATLASAEQPASVPSTDAEVVYMYESLVEGAPTVADILPDTEIAVILPDGSEAPAVEATPAAMNTAAEGELRRVSGDWVNMRAGPGTDYGVVDTLPKGTEVEVFEVQGGWARLRNLATGDEGWMSARLLTDA